MQTYVIRWYFNFYFESSFFFSSYCRLRDCETENGSWTTWQPRVSTVSGQFHAFISEIIFRSPELESPLDFLLCRRNRHLKFEIIKWCHLKSYVSLASYVQYLISRQISTQRTNQQQLISIWLIRNVKNIRFHRSRICCIIRTHSAARWANMRAKYMLSAKALSLSRTLRTVLTNGHLV